MIELRNIDKSFGKLKVLDKVSFAVDQGGILAVLGPNGSGKTTILKIILGMVIPQNGDVLFSKTMIKGSCKYRRNIGYLPQIARFPDNLTVNELIQMIRDIRDMDADESSLIARFKLDKYLDKKLSHLSGGTRQKVNIVLTLMFDSEILILDEPTAGLDPVSLIQLKEIIEEEKAKGKLIIVTTHILSLVESLADEIIFLLEGKIHFRGTVNELSVMTKQNDLEHSIASLLENV